MYWFLYPRVPGGYFFLKLAFSDLAWLLNLLHYYNTLWKKLALEVHKITVNLAFKCFLFYGFFTIALEDIWDALRDLVPFGQFKKRDKNPWRSVALVQPATLLKVSFLHGCFSRFLICTNDTKSRKPSHNNLHW